MPFLKCPKCENAWHYTGKGEYATCTKCLRKFPVKANELSVMQAVRLLKKQEEQA